MSTQVEELIPPPPVIRALLSRKFKETRRLRSLLRLSIQADNDRLAEDEQARAEAKPSSSVSATA
jgi:hypothetical protein